MDSYDVAFFYPNRAFAVPTRFAAFATSISISIFVRQQPLIQSSDSLPQFILSSGHLILKLRAAQIHCSFVSSTMDTQLTLVDLLLYLSAKPTPYSRSVAIASSIRLFIYQGPPSQLMLFRRTQLQRKLRSFEESLVLLKGLYWQRRSTGTISSLTRSCLLVVNPSRRVIGCRGRASVIHSRSQIHRPQDSFGNLLMPGRLRCTLRTCPSDLLRGSVRRFEA